jgi:hypothetical protein
MQNPKIKKKRYHMLLFGPKGLFTQEAAIGSYPELDKSNL